MESAFTSSDARYVAPRTSTERVLADIWTAVLQVDRVGIYDNFADLGGDSIAAERSISRIRDVLQIELPVEALFSDDANIAALAGHIDGAAAHL